MADPRYYGALYFTVTGEIVDEVPLAALPQWLLPINGDGTWGGTTQIASPEQVGDPENVLWEKGRLWSVINEGWRYSCAICYGTGSALDYVAQGGPLMSYKLLSEQPPLLQIGGAGLWALLRATLQLNPAWNGVSLGQDGGADTTYTATLQGIAAKLLADAASRNPMPLDIPAPIAGTDTRTYFGYDLVSAGQRLQELTQVQGGSDILLKPYRTSDNHIRHAARIGNPQFAVDGNPLVFDYPGAATEILPSGDASKQTTDAYVKGNGTAYTTLWAHTADPTLPEAGWPGLDGVDSAHVDVDDQTTLQQWSDSDQALYGRTVQSWTVTVDANNEDYPFGSYDPGPDVIYNVRDHCLLPDGEYTWRLLGLQNGDQVGEVKHLLQGSL